MNKKSIIISVGLLVVLVALLGGYFYLQKSSAFKDKLPHVNYSPATEEDKSRVEDTKQKAVERQDIDNENVSNSPRTVSPSITYAGQYGQNIEVGAYVDGIFENTGTCTAVMKKDGETITKTVNAEKNVRSMDCPVMVFSKSELRSTGLWTVTVSYSSDTAEGKSKDRSIEVK